MKRLQKASLPVLFVLVGLLTSVSVNALENNDYSAGLVAYLEQDYATARTHWLNAARENHAKSMFNLGLLHERRLITGAEQQKADKWFRLAGQNGYAAADYHLALKLIARGQQTQANSLLIRAAKGGFVLASQRLAKKGVVVNTQTNTERILTPDLTPNKPNQGAQYLDERWILRRDSSNWTIQVLAFNDRQKVIEFIRDNRLTNKAAYFKESSDNGVLYKLILGTYASKQQAAEARKKLSSNLKRHSPWLRSIASVQAVIQRQ